MIVDHNWQDIKSIKVISNNIAYGPAPFMDDEVEQYLTISSSGRVWFSARNYEQYCAGKGKCRKKQLSISKWKIDFLFRLVDKITIINEATDCGSYDVDIRYKDGHIDHIYGSLIGDVLSTPYGDLPVNLTPILQRYIPVNSLWVFSGSESQDYGGIKELLKFAGKWEKKFISGKNLGKVFEKNFGDECIKLGFQMDCGKEAERIIPDCLSGTVEDPEIIAKAFNDIDLLGSAVFSNWRFLTHWDYTYELNQDTRNWFIAMLCRMKELCK